MDAPMSTAHVASSYLSIIRLVTLPPLDHVWRDIISSKNSPRTGKGTRRHGYKQALCGDREINRELPFYDVTYTSRGGIFNPKK